MDKTATDITLTCHPELSSNVIRIRYSVSNTGKSDIYLLDIFPGYDAETRKPFADFHSYYLCLRDGATAYLLKGIPPLPANKTVMVRIMPLGTKLEPGQQIDRTFEVSLPLCEQSPWYYPKLPPEAYKPIEIHRLVFAVQFLRSSIEGFVATPAPHDSGLFRVAGKYTVGQTETLLSELKIPPMKFLTRTDRFSRL